MPLHGLELMTHETRLRLWNWHRNGRVFLRWTDTQEHHPQFLPRLERWPESKLDLFLQQISKQIEEFPYDDEVQ